MRQSGIFSRSMSTESISGSYSCTAKLLITPYHRLGVAGNAAIADCGHSSLIDIRLWKPKFFQLIESRLLMGNSYPSA